MALSATLHCLTGCALGEVAGLLLGAALGWGSAVTTGVAVGLAFLLGFSLSLSPLLRAGLPLGRAFSLVAAADTFSIATMEVVDSGVMLLLPGAMGGLGEPLFWVSMAVALLVAGLVAFPVNGWLLVRGRGHALTHSFHHGGGGGPRGWRAWLPAPSTGVLLVGLACFLVGGLVASWGG